jgi:outer membrane protein, heavy metal efflux system
MNRPVASKTTGMAGAAFGLRRTSRCWSLAMLLSAGLAVAAYGAEPLGSSLNLDQLVTTAQRDNKDLRVARYAVQLARARLVQAGALPNPRINASGSSDFAFNNDGAYNASFGISQDFPVAGRILRQKEVAAVDIELAQAEIEDAERRLAGEVAANVYRVLVVDRQMLARETLSAVDERLAKATRSRFKAAEVSELDVNAVALDLQKLAQERALLETQRKALLQALNRQLGRAPDAGLSIIEPLPAVDALPPLEAEVSKALSLRPDLRQVQLQVDRAQAEIALAKAKRWEDWSVGVGIQQDRQVIDGGQAQGNDRALSFNLTIPLSLKNRSRGLLAEAEAAADQSRARAEALKFEINGEVAAAHAEAASLQSLLKTYDDGLLPVARRNVGLAEKGYGQGLVSVVEVVQAQRQQAELNNAQLAALDQYLQALARLRTAVGDYTLLTESTP